MREDGSEIEEPWSASRCSCGMHAIVVGDVPDPDCPIHGDRGVNAWSTCQSCGNTFRHAVGHACDRAPTDEGAES